MTEIAFTARKMSRFVLLGMNALLGAVTALSFFVMLTNYHDNLVLRLFSGVFMCACVYIMWHKAKCAKNPKLKAISFSDNGVSLKYEGAKDRIDVDWADVLSLKYLPGKQYQDDYDEIPVGILIKLRINGNDCRTLALHDDGWIGGSDEKLSDAILFIPKAKKMIKSL